MVTFNGMKYLQSFKSIYAIWSVSESWIIHPEEKECERLKEHDIRLEMDSQKFGEAD